MGEIGAHSIGHLQRLNDGARVFIRFCREAYKNNSIDMPQTQGESGEADQYNVLILTPLCAITVRLEDEYWC